jgi:hypothetical protein
MDISIEATVKAIVSLVRHARKKKRKAEAADGKPQDSWGAMILHEAGPMRSEPIVPVHQINLGKQR